MSQQVQMERDVNYRFGNTIIGPSRGRPRGRRPLRGQFPVVPIDMVRQLGIEQQVILQPAAPVAMRNKSTLCRPLSLSRKTQVNSVNQDFDCQTDFPELSTNAKLESPSRKNSPKRAQQNVETEKSLPKFFPVPVPVPIYVPVPVYLGALPVPHAFPLPIPTPLPLGLMLEKPEECASFQETIDKAEETSKITRRSGRSTSPQKPGSPDSGTNLKRPRSTSIQDSPGQSKRAKIPMIKVSADAEKDFHLKFSYGIKAWCLWLEQKLSGSNADEYEDLRTELHLMSEKQLNEALALFVNEARKANKEPYGADSVYYLCLGIQQYLSNKGVGINIFGGPAFHSFVEALDKILANFQPRISQEGLLICRIEEEHLWEAKQLGSDSPQVLLFSIIYFVTKTLRLKGPADHKKINFSHFKISSQGAVTFTPPKTLVSSGQISSEKITWEPNTANPERCPVKIFQAYQSHCPNSVVSRGDSLYYQPSKQSSSSSWFASQVLSKEDLQFMLNRIKMVKEIQEALMNSQTDQSYF